MRATLTARACDHPHRGMAAPSRRGSSHGFQLIFLREPISVNGLAARPFATIEAWRDGAAFSSRCRLARRVFHRLDGSKAARSEGSVGLLARERG